MGGVSVVIQTVAEAAVAGRLVAAPGDRLDGVELVNHHVDVGLLTGGADGIGEGGEAIAGAGDIECPRPRALLCAPAA